MSFYVSTQVHFRLTNDDDDDDDENIAIVFSV